MDRRSIDERIERKRHYFHSRGWLSGSFSFAYVVESMDFRDLLICDIGDERREVCRGIY